MSAEVAIIALIPWLLSTVGTAAGEVIGSAAVASLASAAAREAVAAARKLQDDYQAALAQMQERHELERAEYALRAGLSAEQSQRLSALAHVRIAGLKTDPRRQQLSAGLAQLAEQLGPLPDAPPSLSAEMAALAEDVQRADCDFTQAFSRYHALAVQVAQARAAAKPGATAAAPDALAAIGALLESPLLAFGPGQADRARFTTALAELAELPASLAAARAQAAAELKLRVESRLDELAELQAQSVAQMDEVASAANEAWAWISALEQCTYKVSAAQAGAQLRHELAALLADGEPGQLKLQLQGLAAQAQAQARQAQTELLQAGLRAELKDAIGEFMRRQGYSVVEIEAAAAGPEELVVRTSSAAGTRIALGANNQAKCELVGFRALDPAEARACEEQHCALVEQLLDALRQRQIEAQVRMIKPADGADAIPVIALPERAPAARRVEEKKYLPERE